MWSEDKKRVLLLCVAGVLLLAISAMCVFGLLLPYHNAKSTMDPHGRLTIQSQNDGTLRVEWPAGENAQSYRLEVLEKNGQVLHAATVTDCFAILPELHMDRELVIRVTSVRNFGMGDRAGDEAIEVTLVQAPPALRQLEWTADVEEAVVTVTFDMDGADLCRVYMATGEGESVLTEETEAGRLQLRFGADEKYQVPAYDQPLHFTFLLERSEDQVFFLSSGHEGFTLTREDMLDDVLNVTCVDNGENSYTLTWNETKGEHYEVLLSDSGGETWQTLASISHDQERIYTTDHLEAYTNYILWVVAVGGQTKQDSEFAAVSQQMQMRTGAKLLYSTIWPLMDWMVYADPEATQELGTATAGSAWCVIGAEGKYLKIRFQGQDGYIDSDYCMINLPEYIGNLCRYDITNSYFSKYLVHEYGIPNVSGTVITGYENVKVGEGEYLVPLLFPMVQKLIKAAEAAREAGYTLKIYDSFRPKKATEDIYSRTYAILDNPLPAYTFSGKAVQDLSRLDWDPNEEEEEPTETTAPPEDDSVGNSPTEPAAPPTEPPVAETPTEPAVLPVDPTEEETAGETTTSASFTAKKKTKSKVLTYGILMTNNGEYSLSKFLAPGTSRHNYGVALDLTMVDSEGRELAMQTSIHDLSWYSVFNRNNANANTLYKFMSGAGLQNISSEWWHYQDNALYETRRYLPLRTGVSFECWVRDDHGWRYRLADGSFHAGCIRTIDGESYTFDENGYVTIG